MPGKLDSFSKMEEEIMEMKECARKTGFDESGIRELSDRIAVMVAQYADEHVTGEECATFVNDEAMIRENEELKSRIEEIKESYVALKKAYDELKEAYDSLNDDYGCSSKEEIEEYKFLAYYDRKMGVKNKNSFNRDVKYADRSQCTLAMLNITGMKAINERSRLEGDGAVKAVAAALKTSFDKKGEVYRLIGDEFGILTSVGKDECERCLNESLDRLSADKISFSYGISVGEESKSVSQMILEADGYMKGMKQLYSLPPEKRTRMLDIQKNVIPKSSIVETRDSKLQPVDIDDDEVFSTELIRGIG